MITFALFGAGRIGRMHAENLVRRNDAKLLYVVDTKPEAARALAQPLGARQATEAEALGDPAVQAVLIASSTGSHADLSVAAAQAGKAIFCEKPVDLTLAKVDKCIAAVKKAKVPMFVGFNRRFDPSFRSLKQRVDAGAIGKVEQVIITNRDPGLPEMRFLATSGGLFLDFTIHDFDMARWLLGEEPVEVYARGAVLVDPRVRTEGNDIDTAMLLLRTATGKMCQISNTRRAVYGYDQRIEVFGSKGMLRAGNVTPTTVERSGADSTCGDNPWPSFQTRYAAAYAAELSSFINSVERRKPSEVPPEDSRRVLLLCEAAKKSATTGQPVKVSKN
jgi:myo-inositol 2-dehydrogenase/D-chiro-inositol 1-dehydrogenase